MEKARAIYDNTIMAERREKIYSGEEYMDRMEIGSSSVDWNLLAIGRERILKYFCRRAFPGQHLDILHISQNIVNALASPWKMSNPAASSMKLQKPWWRNGKFHGIRRCECYSSIPTRVDKKIRTNRTEFVGIGCVLETHLKLQLTRRRELLTDSTRSNHSFKSSNPWCTSPLNVKTFSRRWIQLPFSSPKAFLSPKRSMTAHTLEAW